MAKTQAPFVFCHSIDPSNKDAHLLESAATCAHAIAQGDHKYAQRSWVEAKELYSLALQHAESAAGS